MIQNEIFYDFERTAVLMNIANIPCESTKLILIDQYENAVVVKRDFNKAGFYTYFEVPDNVEMLKEDIKPFGNVEFEINDLEANVGCVLFVKNGTINFFECYTNTGTLPEEITMFSVR